MRLWAPARRPSLRHALLAVLALVMLVASLEHSHVAPAPSGGAGSCAVCALAHTVATPPAPPAVAEAPRPSAVVLALAIAPWCDLQPILAVAPKTSPPHAFA